MRQELLDFEENPIRHQPKVSIGDRAAINIDMNKNNLHPPEGDFGKSGRPTTLGKDIEQLIHNPTLATAKDIIKKKD